MTRKRAARDDRQPVDAPLGRELPTNVLGQKAGELLRVAREQRVKPASDGGG
jgi:hypothetical protein